MELSSDLTQFCRTKKKANERDFGGADVRLSIPFLILAISWTKINTHS